jgi:uncharacterized protein YbjT (DUF2867 family)
MPDVKRVFLTGATGFVGMHVYPKLIEAGFTVVCGSRDPEGAQKRCPGRVFRKIDVADYDSTRAALEGCDAALYLVHSMADVPVAESDYEEQEFRSAVNFARAAEDASLRRIVYLGGIQPRGKVSKHLRSRMRTGEALRAGKVSAIELQATMIIGAGSESWRIVRDLAARLPIMLLPRWLSSKSQPVYVDDVCAALVHALTADIPESRVFPLPGPEIMSARDIIQRTAQLLGHWPRMIGVPVMSPKLSSYWISLVTRANNQISSQLVEGLRSDLVAHDRGYWQLMPEHTRVPFDEAARRALEGEHQTLPFRSKLTEWMIHRITNSIAKRKPSRATT